jgi:hypothetical protein
MYCLFIPLCSTLTVLTARPAGCYEFTQEDLKLETVLNDLFHRLPNIPETKIAACEQTVPHDRCNLDHFWIFASKCRF